MNRTFAALVFVFVAIGAAIACRSTDPETPPNTPIPTVERPKDPTPLPTPNFRDAGIDDTK